MKSTALAGFHFCALWNLLSTIPVNDSLGHRYIVNCATFFNRAGLDVEDLLCTLNISCWAQENDPGESVRGLCL